MEPESGQAFGMVPPSLSERVLFAGLGARGAGLNGLNASLDDPNELFTKAKLKGLGQVT